MSDDLRRPNRLECTCHSRHHLRFEGMPALIYLISRLPTYPLTLPSAGSDAPQLFVVGTHELCHLIAGLLVGGQVVSICIDPNDGGATHILGLMRSYPRVPRNPYAFPTYSQLFWSGRALFTLAAGYVGSSIVGFLFIVSTSRRFC